MSGGGRRAWPALLIALLLSCLTLAACGSGGRPSGQSPPTSAPATFRVRHVSSALFETRLLTIPPGYPSVGRPFYLHARRHPGAPEPLVLLLHGWRQHPTSLERATEATIFSDNNSFTLVYPAGIQEAWNAGGCCGNDRANDVGYLTDVVRYVARLTPIDLHRVYIWGFSNGAMMAWRAVCQTRDVFAGAGVVSGALLVPCPVPVHVVQFHGAADTTVPFNGGYSRLTHSRFPDSADERARLAPGSTLDLHLINGFGHHWPSLRIGSVDAVQVIWDGLKNFRVAHPVIAESRVRA